MNPFDKLYCKLNRVTANWRHNHSVSNRDMDALCNAQVDLEQSGYTPKAKELVPSPNIPMQADAQLSQIILEDLMSFVDSIEGYAKVDRQCIRDRFFRIVAGKLLHG